jgi:hypothetical protein
MGIRNFRTIRGKSRAVPDMGIDYDGNSYRFVEFALSGHMTPEMYKRITKVIDEVDAEMKVVTDKSDKEEGEHILKTGEWRD